MRIWYHHPVKLIIKSSFYGSNDHKCSSFTANVNFKHVTSSVLFFHDVSCSSFPEGLPQAFCLFVCLFLLWWVLSYIEMNQPWIYMCSPSRSPLPPPSPPNPSRSPQCTKFECLSHASNLGW